SDTLYLTMSDGVQYKAEIISNVDLSGIRDSIQNNIDSLADHRTDINQNITDIIELNDSIDQHRIDIDAISEVDDYYHIGDSIRLELSDGRIYTVRDSFLSKQDVATIARDSLEAPDGTHLIN